jgi:hypothetical protein
VKFFFLEVAIHSLKKRISLWNAINDLIKNKKPLNSSKVIAKS